MKHKHQNSVSQSLNSVLGFGWFTGASLQDKVSVEKNKFYKVKTSKRK